MAPSDKTPHLLAIDCARGYAVLMVMGCHLTFLFPELPYPVHRVTASGWFGVQLFFLASSVTLLMSWHRERAAKGQVDVPAFFLRRLFRIAPAYYAAGLFYYVVAPPAGGFDAWQAFASAIFINAWTPGWMPTLPEAWSVVPGGWSVGVEFSFYLLFPLYAAWARTGRRAVVVVIASVGVGLAANLAARAVLAPDVPPEAISNFLFFWFPNQISVFALGGVLFHLLRILKRPGSGAGRWLARHGSACGLASIAAFCGLAFLPLGHYLGDGASLPAGLVASVALSGLMLALSTECSPLVNRGAAALGRVSFSAYLLHFAVLRLMEHAPFMFHLNAARFAAVAAYAAALPVLTGLTFAAAWLSYRLIEQPMIEAGRAVIRRRRLAAVSVG